MENTNPVEHILLADDDADSAILFERVIRKDYPSVIISYVNDGQQLIHFLHLHKIDLLFLDLNMPCKNGYECLQEIRRDHSLKDIPIVVYSSSAHMSDIQKSFLQGGFLSGKTFQYRSFKNSHASYSVCKLERRAFYQKSLLH
jgi:CheY-like chemotaxis protein